MSYVVTLRDKTMVRISDDDAWSLKNCLAESHGTVMVEVGDNMVRSTEVMSISKERFTEADISKFDTAQLPANTCHAEHSIQGEINRIAKNMGGGWARAIANPEWRESVRQRLQESGKQWCDDKAGTCACVSMAD